MTTISPNTDIKKTINSNREFYSSIPKINALPQKQQAVDSFESSNKITYYNDEEAKKKAQKKKIGKWLLLGSGAVATLTAATTLTVALIKGRYKSLDPGKAKDVYKKIIDALEINGTNFGALRDDGFSKIVETIGNSNPFKLIDKESSAKPFKFIETGFNWATKKYHQMSHWGGLKRYKKAIGEILRLQKEGKIPSGVVIPDIKNFDDFYWGKVDDITAILRQKDNTVINDFFQKGKTPQELFHTFTTKNITNEKLAKAGIFDGLKTQIPQGTELSKEAQKAIDDYDKVLKDVVERIRDTANGNAISDIVSMGALTGALGFGIGTEEDPEKRKSKAIDLGIPILTSMLSMVVGTAAVMSGVVAMFTGFAIGEVGTLLASTMTKPPKKPKEGSQLV